MRYLLFFFRLIWATFFQETTNQKKEVEPVADEINPDFEWEEDHPEYEEEPHVQRYMWVLVAGHGIKTRGKRSPVLDDGRQLREYEFNQYIVTQLAKELERDGIAHHVLKNKSGQFFQDNAYSHRVAAVNNVKSDLPKIAVYVHANAGPGRWTPAKGTETWFKHGCPASKEIATWFQREIVPYDNWGNRGIKSKLEKQFYVLRKTQCPAILTENGFFNNKQQVEQLFDELTRESIITGHHEAIWEIEYFMLKNHLPNGITSTKGIGQYWNNSKGNT